MNNMFPEKPDINHPPFPDRLCEACVLKEKITVSRYSSVVGYAVVHFPSGNVCAKFMPQELYNFLSFKLPEGYRAWCHRCGRAPLNKTTDGIPGVGFKTLDESVKHDNEVHDYRKG